MGKKLILILSGVLLSAGIWVSPVIATDDEGVMVTSSQESIDETPVVSENSVRSGNFTVLDFGKNKLITGNNFQEEVELSTSLLFMAGNNLGMSGSAEFGFIAGNTVYVSGWIRKDAFVAGNSINFTEDSYIGGDIYALGNDVVLNSDLNGDLSVSAATLILDNVTINGNVNAHVGNIQFVRNVTINGVFNYNEDANLIDENNLTAENRETYAIAYETAEERFMTRFYTEVIWAIGLFIVIAIILCVRPKYHDHLTEIVSARDVATSIGLGFVSIILVPALVVVFMMTFVGIPLGLIILAIYAIALYSARGIAGVWCGHVLIEKVFKKKANRYIEAIVGIIVITLLGLIPYVGWIITFLSLIFGFGFICNSAICGTKDGTKKVTKKKTTTK